MPSEGDTRMMKPELKAAIVARVEKRLQAYFIKSDRQQLWDDTLAELDRVCAYEPETAMTLPEIAEINYAS